MTNTYIDNGPDRNEDIISSMESGLYCAKMGGGSVNPISGAFNFSVEEGYLVKNGRLSECVKGASLIGTGSEVLLNIDMVGQNRFNGQGMCGSVSGSAQRSGSASYPHFLHYGRRQKLKGEAG